jgi:hypothetical protein
MPYIGRAPTSTATKLEDADQDTKIQLEESSDEDTIRFDTGGSERMTVASGGTVDVVGDLTVGTVTADGDTSAGDNATLGYTSVLGAILTGQGSTNDVTLVNDADATVLSIPTGTTNVTIAGDVTMTGTTPTLTIGDAGAEDAAIVFDGNAQDFHIGLDDTADSLAIGLGSALGTTTHMSFDSTGAVTKPLQPAFNAIVGTTIANVTGDGTSYTVIFNSEEFDTNADFNTTTGLFTAPVAGVYSFTAGISLSGIASDHTVSDIRIEDNTDGWLQHRNNIYAGAAGILRYITLAAVFYMDASDTAGVTVIVYNGSKVVDVLGASYPYSWFSGCLLA